MPLTHQPALIEVANLSYQHSSLNSARLLHQINFKVYPGQSLAILGASGAGKSTLLALIAGLATPTQGEVLWQGQAFSRLSANERAKKRTNFLSYVFQSFHLLPELTAEENLLLPLELNPKISLAQAKQLAQEWLTKVQLPNKAKHKPHQLSGGEQQRVALARALATSPRLLLADEPTGSLDKPTSQQLEELLFSLTQEQAASATPGSLILVTHDEQLAAKCDRQFLLEAGQLTELSAS